MTSPRDLCAVADHLSARRAALLAAWSVAARRDPEVTTMTTLSRTQFYDHIPEMLDALDRKLRSQSPGEVRDAHREESDSAEWHGLQRWQQGYEESELMREWIALNACLADEIDRFAAADAEVAPTVIATACRMCSELTVAGMSESMAQYSRLQRTEAVGRVRALEEALRRLSDLERERNTLWRQATHDLRGNLGVVSNVTQALQRVGTNDPAGADVVRMLARGVTSLHALLDDLSVQARLDAGQEQRDVRPFDAAALIRELCVATKLTAEERNLALEVSGPDTLPVEGDATKVRRIAQNLLLNALAYTTDGGVIVSWAHSEGAPPRWTLCVQDTGPGLAGSNDEPLAVAMEAATRDRLDVAQAASRDPDAQVEPASAPMLPSRSRIPGAPTAGHGEGVGLSIVKRLCELLDASVELQTEAGKGTTFRVTFPCAYPKG